MKLALIIDDYLPHSTRVGAKMMHELACELMQQGHQVTVITPHFDQSRSKLIKGEVDGVEVWRFFSGPIKDVGKITRAINETLLSYRAWALAFSNSNPVKPFPSRLLWQAEVYHHPVEAHREL